MDDYKIGFDAHKRFSQVAVRDATGRVCQQKRIEHEPGAIREFLSQYPAGTSVALENIGNWYWIVDEIEAAGCVPHMAHAARAKVMMGNIHKTDKLDAAGGGSRLFQPDRPAGHPRSVDPWLGLPHGCGRKTYRPPLRG